MATTLDHGALRRVYYDSATTRKAHAPLGIVGVVAPFAGRWNTSWLPDHDKPVQIAARIVDDTYDTGRYETECETPPVGGRRLFNTIDEVVRGRTATINQMTY